MCILLAAAIVTLVLYKENPAEQNEKAVELKKARGQSWDGIAFEEVKRKPYFYWAAVCTECRT